MALGSSLLETFLPDGNRRPNNDREEDFQRNVEDFFRKAACSNYGNEIFNNYKVSQKQEPFQRDSVEIVFHKVDPSVGVLKTKVENDVKGKEELLKMAQSVLADNDNLNQAEDAITTDTEPLQEDTTIFPS